MRKKLRNRNQAYSKKKAKIPVSSNFGGNPDHRSREIPFSKNTVSRVFLYLFILFLPTQLGKHFFFDFSYISGVRVDYLAPTLYVTDLLTMGLIILNWRSVSAFLKQKKVLALLCLLVINVIFATSKPIALYTLIKLVEIISVYAVFKKIPVKISYILLAFLAGGLIEFSLAIIQFVSKQSVQGIFYFLGERYLSLSTPGIAKTAYSGVELLRPYGTFSHPNSLAGFYLLVYFFILTGNQFQSVRLLKNALLLVCSLLILVSFSKVAIGIFVLLNFVYMLKNRSSFSCRFCFISRLTTLIVAGLVFLSASNDPLTIKKRIDLGLQSLHLISSHWQTGVGIGSYVSTSSHGKSISFDTLNQPVHNIFLLALTELGIPLSVVTVLLWKKWLIRFIQGNVFVVLAIVMSGLFDHYWLTLQQNQLLIGVVLGFL